MSATFSREEAVTAILKLGADYAHEFIGDEISLRMGRRRVTHRRLEAPEHDDDDGNRVTEWYWTVIVK